MAIKKKSSVRQKWLIFTSILAVLIAVVVLVLSWRAGIRTVGNIETFARLYGYVKYFHPSDEAAKIDWDRFAVYGVKQVAKTKNSRQLKKTLEQLFLPLAPGMEIYFTREEKIFDPTRIFPEDIKDKKVIAWQHFGVKLTDNPNIYHSIRTNRKNKIALGSGFGNLMIRRNAERYQGKEFLYRAAVKAEQGKAYLWFRVDRPNRETGFFDNMNHRPIQTNQWNVYEIKGTIDKDAETIAYGCFLEGVGKVFTDDFRLSVKEGDLWVPVEIANPGFERDPEGKVPRGWWVRGSGYAFEVTTQTAAAGKKSFMIESKAIDGPMRLFSRNSPVGEHINKELGRGLSCIVPLALYGTDSHTYPAADADAFENLETALKNEDPDQWSANDLNVRWAGVMMAWNVFQHFYPYFDVVKVNWNKVLNRTLRRTRGDEHEKDFLKTLQHMVALLQDGHGNVYHPLMNEMAGFRFKVEWIEKQLAITVSKNKLFKRGDIFLAVDGKDAEDALLEAEKYISGSPQWRRWRSLNRFCYGEKGTTALFKIKRDEQEIEITIARTFQEPIREFYRKNIDELKPGIFYVDLRKLRMEELEEAIAKLAEAKGVIFDARGYVPFVRRGVLSYLIDETVSSPVWNVPQVIYPDRKDIVYEDSNWTVEAKEPKIKGKVVFLTNARAISASETFLGIVEHYRLGEIVGQPTAGANGNVNYFTLPGGYNVFWTGMRVLKHDHAQFHLIGIQPTVPARRTLKGVREGRDELLEKALQIVGMGAGSRDPAFGLKK